jgi:hypothetical protein
MDIGGEGFHNPTRSAMTTTLQSQIKAARADVNALEFGTDAWEAAMAVVRGLVDQISAAKPAEEFCSIDSGIHRTRMLSGRVI